MNSAAANQKKITNPVRSMYDVLICIAFIYLPLVDYKKMVNLLSSHGSVVGIQEKSSSHLDLRHQKVVGWSGTNPGGTVR